MPGDRVDGAVDHRRVEAEKEAADRSGDRQSGRSAPVRAFESERPGGDRGGDIRHGCNTTHAQGPTTKVVSSRGDVRTLRGARIHEHDEAPEIVVIPGLFL